MTYRCEARSVEAFVQQLANLVTKGYRFYMQAQIPPQKDSLAVDAKLIERYRLDLTKSARYRRKLSGRANVAYLRYDRTFVLICTEGVHRFRDENPRLQDIRREPVLFHGYSIGSGMGSDGRHHASVMIHAEAFADLLAYFRGIAVHRSAEALACEFQAIRFSPFARIRRQYLRLLREVNDLRKAAGYSTVPLHSLKLRRTPVQVFDRMCTAGLAIGEG